MGNSSISVTELDYRLLQSALARKDNDEVKELLVKIGKAELSANAPKKRGRPAPANNGNSPL
jgi:hypothetical protein